MMGVDIFALAVHTYCTEFKASETSGRRTFKHNHAVGGKSDSAHLFGLGKDVVYDEAPPDVDHASAFLATQGLMLIREGDHDHLQPIGWKAWITSRPELIPKA